MVIAWIIMGRAGISPSLFYFVRDFFLRNFYCAAAATDKNNWRGFTILISFFSIASADEPHPHVLLDQQQLMEDGSMIMREAHGGAYSLTRRRPRVISSGKSGHHERSAPATAAGQPP
jgi:hypothetical protein